MKKRILFIMVITVLIAMTSVVAKAQTTTGNGGQYAENGSIKIEQLSFSGGKAIIKITNKQSCTADEKVDGLITRYKTIAALSSDTIWITPANNLKIRAKTETNCGSTDFGNVELSINTALPVNLYNIIVTLSHTKQLNPKQ